MASSPTDTRPPPGARPVAWVTGASRGMGADTAIRLAAAGYDVALTARDQSRLDGVAGDVVAGGTIINMSSSVVFLEPPGTVHTNGWSLAYAAAKAGIDQFARLLNVELGPSGIRAFNVEPGFVAYGEALKTALDKYPGVPVSPPESIGRAIVWLVESPAAERLRSKRVNLPALAHRQGLLPGWDGPGAPYPALNADE